jgi:hypothetical protein
MTWFDNNELISYPLVDDSSGLDHDVIVDLLIHVPGGFGDIVISSISVTALVVSVVLSAGGEVIAYITVENTADIVQIPLDLEPVVSGVSGTITLGSGITRRRLRLDGAFAVLPECVIVYPLGSSDPTVTVHGIPIGGRVSMVAGPGVEITAETMRVRLQDSSIVTTTVAKIGLIATNRLVAMNPCEVSAEAEALRTPPIREINGVLPDINGNLEVVAVTIMKAPGEPVVSIVDSGVPGRIFVSDPGDACA